MPKTLYDILGVAPSASDEELLAALMRIEQKLAGANDPASMEELRLAREAFAILSTHRRKSVTTLFADTDPIKFGQNPFAPPARTPANPCLAIFQRPAFLAFLIALLALLTFWQVETSKIRTLETQRAANESSLAEALAAKNKELALKEQALEQARQALDEKQYELETKRIEVQQQLVDAYKDTRMRQTEAQENTVNRTLDIVQPKVGAEADLLNAQASMVNTKTRIVAVEAQMAEKQFKDQIANEGYAIKAQKALLDKYEQQRLNGEDGFTRSNPGLDR